MPEPIRFLLNGEELAVLELSPQTTLLDSCVNSGG